MAGNILKAEDVKPGLTVKVHQKIKELTSKGAEKERIQIYEGIVMGVKKGRTMTVRKISHGIGVEKIFPFDLPAIDKIELVKEARGNVRRAKLNYLRKSPRAMREN
jgi:large subunit ribosomal protein L19